MEYKDTIIQNVSDFLLWVKETNKTEVMSDEGKPLAFEDDYGYYRGQSCVCWELKPSVLREPPYLDENSLLKKATPTMERNSITEHIFGEDDILSTLWTKYPST